MVTQQEQDEAVMRGEEDLRTQPRVLSARYDMATNSMYVDLNTGYTVSFSPQRCQILANATSEQLTDIEIDYPGFSLYFPKIDEAFLTASIAEGRFGSDRWEEAWLAANPLELRPMAQSKHSEAA